MKKMRSFFAGLLVLGMSLCMALPALAMDNAPILSQDLDKEILSSKTYYVDKDVREADIQRQLAEYMTELLASTPQPTSDYEYSYSVEYGEPQLISKGGYPGNQPSHGTKFAAPGGAFTWQPDGGPSYSLSVSFPPPFNFLTKASISLGIATTGASNVGIVQTVENYTDYVKLYVIKTQEITPFIVYRTNLYTGEKSEYSKNHLSSMYSYEFDVVVV